MLTIAKIDRFDTVNNPLDGTPAVTIWFSGCNFRCKNCHNRKLWNKNSGTTYSARLVASVIKATCTKVNAKSVVFLGGEPLQQNKDGLLYLCKELKDAGIKIWLYTGYDFDCVEMMFKDILPMIYTIKCGKYNDKLKQDGFPASSNQRIYRTQDNKWVDITAEFR